MIMWIKSHKALTSVTCLLLVAALAGTALLLSNHRNTVTSADETAFGTYSGISENDTVTVTMADGTTAEQYAGTRDPWLWPFSSDSIWNMPIGNNAALTAAPVFKGTTAETAALSTGSGNTYGADSERIYLTTQSDNQYMVIRGRGPCTTRSAIKDIFNNGGLVTYSGTKYNILDSTENNYEYNKGTAYWPTGLVVNDDGNEIAAILQPDRRTIAQFQSNRGKQADSDPDLGLALFPYDRTYDSSVSEEEKFLISNLALVDIYGDGIYGSHWGSSLSAMGGSIREGELTDENVDIHHALKLNIDQTLLFYGIVTQEALYTCNPDGDNGHYVKGDVIPGYVWPASSRDGQDSQTYTGSNPFVSMGSLLTISESDYQSLLATMKTEIGRKMLYALRYYGCYIVDNSAYKPWEGDKQYQGMAWSVSDKELTAVEETYGINMRTYSRRSTSDANTATRNYCADMDQIILCLRAVTNNTSGSIGGGGTPSKPLAPEIIPLEGITVSDQTIPLGSNTTLDVVCTPTNASVQKVTYSSYDTSVIDVSEDGATLKGLQAGSAIITVTSVESGFTQRCTVTVSNGDVNGDGKVDAKDYTVLSNAIRDNPVSIEAEDKKRYDINGDGDVNKDDLDALKALLSKGGSAQ